VLAKDYQDMKVRGFISNSLRHSREGGNPLFARFSGYPIKSGMTICNFRRTVVKSTENNVNFALLKRGMA